MFGFYQKRTIVVSIAIFSFIFLLSAFSLYASELSSTNYVITDFIPGSGSQMSSTNFSVSGNLSGSSFGSWATNAFPLVPGTITSCGKITASGTYTLGLNLTGISGPCFVVQANDVTINGAGFSVTAGAGNTNYAVVATSSVSGANGYGTTTIQNIIFSGFDGGINANGNNNLSGAGGNGGNVLIASSTLGSITSLGGSGSNSLNSGLGGSIFITGTNLNLSNNTYTANTLNLSYSGTLQPAQVSTPATPKK